MTQPITILATVPANRDQKAACPTCRLSSTLRPLHCSPKKAPPSAPAPESNSAPIRLPMIGMKPAPITAPKIAPTIAPTKESRALSFVPPCLRTPCALASISSASPTIAKTKRTASATHQSESVATSGTATT